MPDYRVRNAFRELRERGFYVHRNICCDGCAIEETMARAGHARLRGAIYSTVADQEHRKRHGHFSVAFLLVEDEHSRPCNDNAPVAIGHEAAAVFQKHGLTVHWGGSAEQRITIVERLQ